MATENSKPVSIILLVLVSLIAAIGLFIASTQGIGLWSDSQIYIGAARGLIAGYGYQIVNGLGLEPVTIIPPLYPTILALSGLFKVDPLDEARWVQILFFAGNTFLFGLVLYRMTKGSTWTAIVGAVIFLSAFDVRLYHLLAFSEASFLFFALLGFYFLIDYLEKPRMLMLAACSFSMGLSFIARYAGYSWVLSAFLAILLFSDQSLSKRFRDASIYGSIATFPMGLWMLRNLSLHQSAVGRHFGLNKFLTPSQIVSFQETVSVWLFNNGHTDSQPLLIGGIALVALVFFITYQHLLRKEIAASQQFMLPLLFILSNMIVLVGAAAFFQSDLLMETTRHLLPAHVMFLLLVFYLGHLWYASSNLPLMKVLMVGASVGMGAWFLQNAAKWILVEKNSGEGYANSQFKQSKLVLTAEKLPLNTILYTNLSYPFEIYTGLAIRDIPCKKHLATGVVSDSYENDMRAMSNEMRKKPAVLIFFNEDDGWFEFPTMEEIMHYIRLDKIQEESDGQIYRAVAAK